jgi:hypothetical protein
MSPGAQNMNTGADTLGTVENESERANMKMGPDALRIVENVFERAKHENGTGRSRYRRKHIRERKTRKQDQTPSIPLKMSPGAQS